MIKLSEEDLMVFHEVIDAAHESGEAPEAVQRASKILEQIENEMLERGLADIKVVSD